VAGDLAPAEPIDVGAAPNRLVVRYLTEISAHLPGPARWHRELMTELRDGLTDAIAHYQERGQSSEAAAARAVRDSGPAEVVAAAYASLIRMRQARSTAFALLVSGPAIGLAWLVTLTPGQTPDALLLRVPPLALLVFIAATGAAITLVTTGSHGRWLSHCARLPHRAAFTACLATALCDMTILTVAASQWLGGPSGHPPTLIIAALASASRLGLAQYAARQHLSAARAI
jgi:hypothetical protein